MTVIRVAVPVPVDHHGREHPPKEGQVDFVYQKYTEVLIFIVLLFRHVAVAGPPEGRPGHIFQFDRLPVELKYMTGPPHSGTAAQ